MRWNSKPLRRHDGHCLRSASITPFPTFSFVFRLPFVSPTPLGSQSSFLLLCLQLGLDRAFCLEQIQALQPHLVRKQSDPRVVHTPSSPIERPGVAEATER